VVIERNVDVMPAPIKNSRLSYAMVGNDVSVEFPFRLVTRVKKTSKIQNSKTGHEEIESLSLLTNSLKQRKIKV
jgi:hypothetical protein